MARPRKPDHLKIVAGTDQKCRMNPNAPKPKPGVPDAPPYLSDKARAAWDYIAPIVRDMGVLTEADGPALANLCETLAELREARQALAERQALTYATETESGSKIHRSYPENALVSDLDKRVKSWFAAFGLTPADRSRVAAGKKEDENPFAEFMS
jgi:P27 family predicted phage terminase small subunit